MHAHIARLFDTGAAADSLSQRLLTSNPFTAHMATIVIRKTGTAMEQRYITAYVTKELLDTVERLMILCIEVQTSVLTEDQIESCPNAGLNVFTAREKPRTLNEMAFV